jgi:hypothetical protein
MSVPVTCPLRPRHCGTAVTTGILQFLSPGRCHSNTIQTKGDKLGVGLSAERPPSKCRAPGFRPQDRGGKQTSETHKSKKETTIFGADRWLSDWRRGWGGVGWGPCAYRPPQVASSAKWTANRSRPLGHHAVNLGRGRGQPIGEAVASLAPPPSRANSRAGRGTRLSVRAPVLSTNRQPPRRPAARPRRAHARPPALEPFGLRAAAPSAGRAWRERAGGRGGLAGTARRRCTAWPGSVEAQGGHGDTRGPPSWGGGGAGEVGTPVLGLRPG